VKEELIGQTVEIWWGEGGMKECKILDIADGLMKLQDTKGSIFWTGVGAIHYMRSAQHSTESR
jgi:hypothetical protein